MAKKVRVLVDTNIEGCYYKINQVVELPDSVVKPYVEAGVVDASKAAVSYALSEGAAVVVHAEVIEGTAVVVDPVVPPVVDPAAQTVVDPVAAQ